MEKKGDILAALDLLIAAHARAVNPILIINHQAFGSVPNLRLEDWTI